MTRVGPNKTAFLTQGFLLGGGIRLHCWGKVPKFQNGAFLALVSKSTEPSPDGESKRRSIPLS